MKACCKKLLRGDRTGMLFCGCGKQWFVFTPGWAKRWGTDRVYHDGEFVGTATFYGELRALVSAGGSKPCPEKQ